MDWGDVAYEAAYWSSVEDRAKRLGLLGADIEEALDSIERLGHRLANAESVAAIAVAVVDNYIELPGDDESLDEEQDEE